MRPDIPPGSHPIETGNYVIGTDPIDNVYRQILSWVRLRIPGATIKGPSRYGKTWAIKYWRMLLSEDYPTLACFVFLCTFKRTRNVSEDKFDSWLLGSLDHTFANAGKAHNKRTRRIVVFIDDAHRLHREHYEWLMDITNEIEAHRGRLTIILVGQPELEHQRDVFIMAKQLQIVGRFMVQSAEFHGLP